jgi:hypothetical protein
MTPATYRVLAIALAIVAPRGASAQQPLPVLRYDAPANFYKSAIPGPEQYMSTEVNASLQVYQFRRYTGDILQSFQRTMLREWIDPQYQETIVPARPTFGRDTMPGAQAVFTARFVESVAGVSHERLRILVVAGGAAAIVDASAVSAYAWQRAGPALRATLASLRVVAGTPEPLIADEPSASAGGDASIVGLFVGIKQRYTVNLMGPVGSGRWMPSTHYYLFSPGGRVYRAYELPSVPGGDLRRFDYDAAQRSDPDNSGRYTVQGGKLVMRMGGSQPETITASLPRGDRLLINSIIYNREK